MRLRPRLNGKAAGAGTTSNDSFFPLPEVWGRVQEYRSWAHSKCQAFRKMEEYEAEAPVTSLPYFGFRKQPINQPDWSLTSPTITSMSLIRFFRKESIVRLFEKGRSNSGFKLGSRL
jgi:hypothetical protein